jgi:curved DNA-binding protein CbpA
MSWKEESMKQTRLCKEDLRVLDLPPRASWQEVQTRYRQLVLSYHPDVNPSGQTAERFRQIASAYESLRSIKREQESRSANELARIANDPRIREMSAEELGMRLRYSNFPKLRAAAAYLLAKREGDESRMVLRRAIRDEDKHVRRAAVEGLGDIGLPADTWPCLRLALGGELVDAMTLFTTAGRIWLRALQRQSPLRLLSRMRTKRPTAVAGENGT